VGLIKILYLAERENGVPSFRFLAGPAEEEYLYESREGKNLKGGRVAKKYLAT